MASGESRVEERFLAALGMTGIFLVGFQARRVVEVLNARKARVQDDSALVLECRPAYVRKASHLKA